MLKIKEAIVVEGRYDKNKLAQLVDTVILETSGFGIFKDKEQLALLRKIFLLVPLALVLPRVTGSVMGIYASEPIADLLASATTLTLFLRRRKTLLPTAGAEDS